LLEHIVISLVSSCVMIPHRGVTTHNFYVADFASISVIVNPRHQPPTAVAAAPNRRPQPPLPLAPAVAWRCCL
jgi:hypothetical protein